MLPNPISVGAQDDPAVVRDTFLKNPDQLALLKQNNPSLAEALLSGNLGKDFIPIQHDFFFRQQKSKILKLNAIILQKHLQRHSDLKWRLVMNVSNSADE